MKSSAKNRAFDNEVSAVSIRAGVDIHIARNVVRWRKDNWKPSKKKDYTYGLKIDQLQGPFYRKVKYGIAKKPNAIQFFLWEFEKDCYFDFSMYDECLFNFGMQYVNGTLYTAEEWKEMNA